MGFFSSIFKGVKSAVKAVGKVAGAIIKKPLPTILGVASKVIPGISVVSGIIGKVTGTASKVIQAAGGGGEATEFEKAVQESVAAGVNSGNDSAGGANESLLSMVTGAGVFKVVIYQRQP